MPQEPQDELTTVKEELTHLAFLIQELQRTAECGTLDSSSQERGLRKAWAWQIELFLKAARLHRRRQEWSQALEACRQALSLESSNAEAHYQQAKVYQALGETRQAEESYLQAIVLNPHWAAPRFALALLYKDRGDDVHALREFREAAELEQDESQRRKAESLAVELEARWRPQRQETPGAGIQQPMDETVPHLEYLLERLEILHQQEFLSEGAFRLMSEEYTRRRDILEAPPPVAPTPPTPEPEEALEQIGPHRELLSTLIEALQDEKWRVRQRAALELGKQGPAAREAIPILVEALKDNERRVREAVAQALVKIGPDTVLPLIEALQDRNWGVRHNAAWVLGKIGPDARDAVPALIEALQDENEDVRQRSAWALGEMGPDAKDAVPALIEALGDVKAPVRAAAVTVIENLGPEAVPALIEALQDEDWNVRQTATEALQEIGEVPEVPQVSTPSTPVAAPPRADEPAEVQRVPPSPPKPPRRPIRPDFGAIWSALLSERNLQAMLYIGALLLLISSLALTGISWEQDDPLSEWGGRQAVLMLAALLFFWIGYLVRERWNLHRSGGVLLSIGALWVPLIVGHVVYKFIPAEGKHLLPGIDVALDLPIQGWFIIVAIGIPAYALLAYRFRLTPMVYVTGLALGAALTIMLAWAGLSPAWQRAAVMALGPLYLWGAHRLRRRGLTELGTGLFWMTHLGIPAIFVALLSRVLASPVVTNDDILPLAFAAWSATALYGLSLFLYRNLLFEYLAALGLPLSLFFTLWWTTPQLPLAWYGPMMAGIAGGYIVFGHFVRKSPLWSWTRSSEGEASGIHIDPMYVVGYALTVVAAIWSPIWDAGAEVSRLVTLYTLVGVYGASAYLLRPRAWFFEYLAAGLLPLVFSFTLQTTTLPREWYGLAFASLGGAYILFGRLLRPQVIAALDRRGRGWYLLQPYYLVGYALTLVAALWFPIWDAGAEVSRIATLYTLVAIYGASTYLLRPRAWFFEYLAAGLLPLAFGFTLQITPCSGNGMAWRSPPWVGPTSSSADCSDPG
ncbi:MAG: HEAT repeat domain-containing protein [Anaerolineae bacterium]